MSNNPENPDQVGQGASTRGSAGAVDGLESLEQLSDRLGPLPWELVRWFAFRISELLEPVHAKGLAHGGISPEAIHLVRPWPELEVILSKVNTAPGSSIDDLRDLGKTMERLLSGGGSGGDVLPRKRQRRNELSKVWRKEASPMPRHWARRYWNPCPKRMSPRPPLPKYPDPRRNRRPGRLPLACEENPHHGKLPPPLS